MILVDSSAWIEFLRDTGSPACRAVDRALRGRILTTDPIVMEILAGGRDDAHLHDLRALLGRAHFVSCTSADYLSAAMLFRRCRQQGETIRRLNDCLIAAVAVRRDVAILHADKDFEVLARLGAVRSHPVT